MTLPVKAGRRLRATLLTQAALPASMDEAAKKTTLRMVPYGLYLMGARRKDVKDVATDVNAFVASWLTQVSFKPPMVAVGVKRDAHSLEMIKESGVFSINVLGSDQKEFATKFFKDLEVTDKTMSGQPYTRDGPTGCPILPDTPASFECEVVHVYEGENDHAVVVGKLVDATLRKEAKPLTHAETGWHYAG